MWHTGFIKDCWGASVGTGPMVSGFPLLAERPHGSQIQINIAETLMHVNSGVKSMVLSNHIYDLKIARGPIWTPGPLQGKPCESDGDRV